MEIGLGYRVRHGEYGEGIVIDESTSSWTIFFRDQDRELSKSFEGFEVIDYGPDLVVEQSSSLDIVDIESTFRKVLLEITDIQHIVDLGDKWEGGLMILRPANEELKSKEIPIETFFHKIVMMRDRLRVLEQSINSHKGLSDEEKVNLQQYITRCYGSMTTFNVLFDNKEDYFSGS